MNESWRIKEKKLPKGKKGIFQLDGSGDLSAAFVWLHQADRSE